jgi:hypothetical protein
VHLFPSPTMDGSPSIVCTASLGRLFRRSCIFLLPYSGQLRHGHLFGGWKHVSLLIVFVPCPCWNSSDHSLFTCPGPHGRYFPPLESSLLSRSFPTRAGLDPRSHSASPHPKISPAFQPNIMPRPHLPVPPDPQQHSHPPHAQLSTVLY